MGAGHLRHSARAGPGEPAARNRKDCQGRCQQSFVRGSAAFTKMSQDAIVGPEIEASTSQVQHVEDRQTVVFRLSGESYGIDIFRVNEIIRMRDITPIPRTEAHIRGLVNLRGKTIPVVDLRVRMGLEVVEETDSSRIIVVDAEDGQVGIIVDAVNEVVTLEGQHIEPTPSLANDDQTEFVEAVAKRDAELVTLLNLDRALAA